MRKRPFYRRPRVLALGGVLLVVFIGTLAWEASWRRRHAAPLGRSAAAVDSALGRLLPAGTTLDSAVAALRRAGADYSILEPGQHDLAADTLSAGGPMIAAALRDVDTDLFVTESVGLRLAFDPSRRLVRRRVDRWLTGP
jgi:hypothetical protein